MPCLVFSYRVTRHSYWLVSCISPPALLELDWNETLMTRMREKKKRVIIITMMDGQISSLSPALYTIWAWLLNDVSFVTPSAELVSSHRNFQKPISGEKKGHPKKKKKNKKFRFFFFWVFLPPTNKQSG